MTPAIRQVVRFLKREDGPTAVEYAVMLALIVIVCIAALVAVGEGSGTTFNDVDAAASGS